MLIYANNLRSINVMIIVIIFLQELLNIKNLLHKILFLVVSFPYISNGRQKDSISVVFYF